MRPIGDEIPLSYNQLGSPMSRSENAAPGKPMCDRLHQKGPMTTIIRKIWDRHVVTERPDGMCLLYIDRHLVHEVTSPQAFEALRLPGPEPGLILPGATVVCGDSHTSTLGAFGSIAFGIGTSEVEHALATQTLWQKRPREMRMTVTGATGFAVSAKDLILAVIAKIGAGGGSGCAIEYAGEAVRRMSMEERLTICNMTIEAGGRFGMVAPDETTFADLSGRPAAPGGAPWAAP